MVYLIIGAVCLLTVGLFTIALCVLSSRLSRQEEDRWGYT